ncbi:MAG: hypothetical protein AB7R89_03400 [Dehalococcoidia bacterium]
MSSPERGSGPGQPEQPSPPESEPPPYYRAARFTDERTAAGVYRRAEQTIHRTPCDLSAYRFLLDQVSHVALIGAPPPPQLDQVLADLFAAGEPATLPSEVLRQLSERRAQASRIGPWVEGHYRPGRRL